MEFAEIIERAGQVMEGAGVLIIILGAVVATIRFFAHNRRSRSDAYRVYRQSVGRAILLGLEFLVAGDIIHTVAVDLTFRSVGLLAAIVAIRTFLSLDLELEIEGRWPWQSATETGQATTTGATSRETRD